LRRIVQRLRERGGIVKQRHGASPEPPSGDDRGSPAPPWLRPSEPASRDIAVPFDEDGNGAEPSDDDLEELPHRVGDRAIVTVDEQEVSFIVRCSA